METYSYLEEFVQALYRYADLPRQPSFRQLEDAFHVTIGTDAPTTGIEDEVILLQAGNTAEEWEKLAHELGHFLRDNGHYADVPPLYRGFIEYKAEQFMYHFCVPTFLLDREELPFCRTEAIRTIIQRYGVTKRLATKRLEMYEQKLLAQYEND